MTEKRGNVIEVGWQEDFWKEHHSLVTALCRRMVPYHDWESAVQEVFVKAFENRETLSNVDKPSAWLSRVTRNHCLNILRDTREAPIPFEELAERYQMDENSHTNAVEKKIWHEQLLVELRRQAALYKPPWDDTDWRIFEAFYGGEKRTAKEVAALLRMEFNEVRYRFNHHIRPVLKKIEAISG